MECPKINKYYIIPTSSWLKPLEPLIITDMNTTGLLILAKNIKNEKVIVKITKEYKPIVIKINKLIKNMPNFIETYCSFRCYEDFTSLDTIYNKKDGFCNGSEKNGTTITLEIMKKYNNGSLSKYSGKLNLIIVTSILSQLLLAQIHAYYNIGFLHNDINLGNILITKSKTELNYSFRDIKLKINAEYIPLLSDFDRSKLFTKEYLKNKVLFDKEYYEEHNIIQNLIDTFKMCLLLLEDNNFKKIIENKYNKDVGTINNKIINSRKNIRAIYKYDYIEYDYFIRTEISGCYSLVNMFYRYFTNKTNDELIPQLHNTI